MGTTARLSDRPTLLFGILQGIPNVFVQMVRHFLAFLLLLRSIPLYHCGGCRRSGTCSITIRSLDEISLKEIREYFHWLIVERKLASSSCNQKLAAIRWFYKTVLRQSLDLRVPMKRSGRLPEPLSHQEIDRLFQAVNNIKHRALLMTAYGGGLRVSELVRLRVDDIHSDRMLILVRRGKGDKDRYTALSHRLLQELRVYWMQYRPEPWLFPGSNPDVPLTASTAQRAFYRAKTRAGIRHGRGIHSLRHSFATHLLEGGTRLPLIQRLLGHSTFTTTTRYLHVTQKHLGCVKSPLDLLRMPSEDELE